MLKTDRVGLGFFMEIIFGLGRKSWARAGSTKLIINFCYRDNSTDDDNSDRVVNKSISTD